MFQQIIIVVLLGCIVAPNVLSSTVSNAKTVENSRMGSVLDQLKNKLREARRNVAGRLYPGFEEQCDQRVLKVDHELYPSIANSEEECHLVLDLAKSIMLQETPVYTSGSYSTSAGQGKVRVVRSSFPFNLIELVTGFINSLKNKANGYVKDILYGGDYVKLCEKYAGLENSLRTLQRACADVHLPRLNEEYLMFAENAINALLTSGNDETYAHIQASISSKLNSLKEETCTYLPSELRNSTKNL